MTNSRYLYVVAPVRSEDEDKDWGGSINLLNKAISKNQIRTEELITTNERAMRKDISIIETQLDKVQDNQEMMQSLLKTLLTEFREKNNAAK